jgi:ribosomal-protein-serine acetyltransferase
VTAGTGAQPKRPPARLSCGELVLERWRRSDLEALQEAVAANAKHLAAWLAWAGDGSPQALDTFLRETGQGWQQGERFEYGVWLAKPDRALIGSVGLMARIGRGGLEIGYWVDTAHTRRRVATRSAALVTAAAFELPGIERVEIHHDEANAASRGVPELLGFERVGTFPRALAGATSETGREVRWRLRAADFAASGAARIAAG